MLNRFSSRAAGREMTTLFVITLSIYCSDSVALAAQGGLETGYWLVSFNKLNYSSCLGL